MTAGKMIGMAVVLLFTAATPLGLMAWLHKKRGGRWLSFLIGALFFPVFAMMLEPLLHIIALKSPLGAVMQNNIWVLGLYGGMEAFLLVGMAMVNNLLLGMLLMGGGEIPPELAEAADTLTATPAVMFLWSVLERVSAMTVHAANSVLVFAAVRTGKWLLFPAAILLHAGMNFVAVVSAAFLPTAAVEGLVLAFALLTAILAAKVYRGLVLQADAREEL